MLQSISSVFFLLVAVGLALSLPETRILGGNRASETQFPYQATLFYNNSFICGGAILSRKTILTAAHCTHKNRPQELSVGVGSINKNRFEEKFTVSSVWVHPSFNPSKGFNDVSLIFLDKPLSYSQKVQRITLPPGDSKPEEGKIATVSGFGGMDSEGTFSEYLRYAHIPIRANSDCSQYYSAISEKMICAGENHGQVNSCPGDSGGPLVLNDYVIGVVSRGDGCGEAAPVVYTNIPSYRDYIAAFI